MKSKYLIGICLLIAFFACKKSKTSLPDQSNNGVVTYYAKAITSNSQNSVSSNSKSNTKNSSAIGQIKWKSASIYVTGIAFEGTNSSQVISSKVINANLNLFAIDDSIGKIGLPLGEYKDVKVMLHLKKSEKSELSFLLKASFTDRKGIVIPLQIANSDEFQVKLSVVDILINPNKNYKAVINYQLDKVLEGISSEELEAGYRYPDGTIGISSSVNEVMYNKIKKNWQITASAEFIENK